MCSRYFETTILDMYDKTTSGRYTICSRIEDQYKVKILQDIIEDDTLDTHTRFGAFIFLFTAYRRENHPIKLAEIVTRYQVLFDNIAIFNQYVLLSLSYVGEFERTKVNEYLDICESLVANNPKNIGAVNAACEVIVSLCEQK